MNNTLGYKIQYLLKENKISVDFEELNFQIQSHPTYPSLNSITGVLDHFNIKNLALNIPLNSNTLQQLPNVFLAQVEIYKQKEFVIVNKLNEKYQLTQNNKEKKLISETEFLNQFTGIILVINKDADSISINKNKSNLLIQKALLTLIIALGMLSFLLPNTNITNLLFFTFSAFGVYISYAIYKQENGKNTLLGNAFCSKSKEKKNCNAVLSSKGSKIYKNIKLSDLSITYFIGLTIATYLLNISNTIFTVKMISILALPMVIYSIYYQAVVIKKWCLLCLSIVGVIALQASLSLLTFNTDYNADSILITTMSFILSLGVWVNLSNFFKTKEKFKLNRLEHFKFKRNFELFNSQLNKSTAIDTSIINTKELIFGNKESTLNLTIMSNPLCGHCKPVHNLITQILNRYKDLVKVTVRFNVNTNNINDKATQIALRLLELNNTTKAECLNAMHDIYSELKVNQWFKKWEYCQEPEKFMTTLINEQKWCTNNAINFTPEILINGKSFPKIYKREDLIYFIEDLNELHNTEAVDLKIAN